MSEKMLLEAGDVIKLRPEVWVEGCPKRFTIEALMFAPDGAWEYQAHDEDGIPWWIPQARIERYFEKRIEVQHETLSGRESELHEVGAELVPVH